MNETESYAEENDKYISAIQNLPRTTSYFGSENFTKEVACLLIGMGMEKYIDILKKNNISLEFFLSLTEEDLKVIGIEDEDDCATIVHFNSLGNKIKGSSTRKPTESIDIADDILIANNLLSHCIRLNSNMSFLIRKLSKNNLTDYYISQEFNAKELLSIVCAKAIQQCELNSKLLHGNDGLIDSILLAEKIQLPSVLKNKLDGKRVIRKKRLALVLLISTGVCSLAILANSYLRAG